MYRNLGCYYFDHSVWQSPSGESTYAHAACPMEAAGRPPARWTAGHIHDSMDVLRHYRPALCVVCCQPTGRLSLTCGPAPPATAALPDAPAAVAMQTQQTPEGAHHVTGTPGWSPWSAEASSVSEGDEDEGSADADELVDAAGPSPAPTEGTSDSTDASTAASNEGPGRPASAAHQHQQDAGAGRLAAESTGPPVRACARPGGKPCGYMTVRGPSNHWFDYIRRPCCANADAQADSSSQGAVDQLGSAHQ